MSRQYSEFELIEAIDFIDKNPGQSIASVAKKFAIPRMTLVGRLQGANSSIGRRGPNTTLSDTEEKAICTYLDHLDSLSHQRALYLMTFLLSERTGHHALSSAMNT
jgi:hypothetical protein